jgi:hypothetical protein
VLRYAPKLIPRTVCRLSPRRNLYTEASGSYLIRILSFPLFYPTSLFPLFSSCSVCSLYTHRLAALPRPPHQPPQAEPQAEPHHFLAAPAHLVNADALGPFIRDFFALTAYTPPTLDVWGRGNSYYPASSTRFLEEHLWVWWFEQRVKGASLFCFVFGDVVEYYWGSYGIHSILRGCSPLSYAP